MKMALRLKGRGCSRGIVEVEAVVSEQPFGFWQGIDPEKGVIVNRRHDLSGVSIKGKAFVFPHGRGSTGTPGIFLQAVRNGVAPAAIINLKSEPMIIACAMLAEEFYGAHIPVVDELDQDPIKTIRTGDRLRVDGQSGVVEIIG